MLLLEAFKKGLLRKVVIYLNENKTSDVFNAAVMIDEYIVVHKPVCLHCSFRNNDNNDNNNM